MNGAEYEFELVSGHLAIDLVNTVSWRLDPGRRIDRTPNNSELLRWAEAAGVLSAADAAALREAAERDPGPADAALRTTLTLRETLHAILVRLDAGADPSPDDLRSLHRLVLDALAHAIPAASLPLRWSVTPGELADLPRLLALAGMELLRTEDLSRVHRCEAKNCGWFFLDRTRSHTRRWCSSADCGNRERARRHYARHRAKLAAGSGKPRP
jgi:predicted RNA-binding Zn ribbon-like protein